MRKVVFVDVVHDVLREKLNANEFSCVDVATKTKEEILSQIKTAFGIVVRSRFTLDSHNRFTDNKNPETTSLT